VTEPTWHKNNATQIMASKIFPTTPKRGIAGVVAIKMSFVIKVHRRTLWKEI